MAAVNGSVSGAPADDARTRYLIVDGHRLFADVVQRTLDGDGLGPGATVSTTDEARRVLAGARPDLVLIDVGPDDRGALDLAAWVRDRSPSTRLVALAASSDPHLVAEAAESGFHGFLPKDAAVDRFRASLRAVLAGETVIPPTPSRSSPSPGGPDVISSLTPREMQVFDLLAAGLPTRSIADRLGVSTHTVRSHVQNVMTKLGVHSRLEASSFAARHGRGPSAERRRRTDAM